MVSFVAAEISTQKMYQLFFPYISWDKYHHTPILLMVILRRVHTNPLKCALDQIASSRFEPIRIRSVHTLFTESEFDYGLPKIYCEAHNDMKVYLEIYAI